MSQDCSYQETIAYLYGLQKHGIKLALYNTEKLLEALGNPHRNYPCVHIAGTNGKGSTAAFISEVLLCAGYRVGLYTSPHLIHFGERIRVNGAPISEHDIIRIAQRVRDASGKTLSPDGAGPLNPTFFEITTAIAFSYFAEKKVDIAVIETGMGGRLDATNIITPLVSVITNIDIEHTQFLGDSLAQIAYEKAGIIKERVPVVTGASQPEAIAVLERIAAERRAPLYLASRDFLVKNVTSGNERKFDYHGPAEKHESLSITMLGAYQVDNAGLAAAAIECLKSAGIRIEQETLRRGLHQTRWEGRLEKAACNPDVFLDGAHNPASAKKLAAAIGEMKAAYRRLVLVIGLLEDKDCTGILSALLPLADRVVATQPDYSRSMASEMLASEIKKRHSTVEKADTCAEAISLANRSASPNDLILITGSLYLVGEARAFFFSGHPAGAVSQSLSELKG